MDRKLVLLNPPYERIAPGYDFVRHVTNRSPSLGLLHLAGEVRKHGWNPILLEADQQGLDAEGCARRIVEHRPRYLGITLFTVGVAAAVEVSRRVRQQLPGIRIIIGGPHVASMGLETLERHPEFDVAVLGEGEQALVELLQAWEDGKDLRQVPGLCVRDQDRLQQTGPRVNPKVLDEFADPAWDLLDDFPSGFNGAIFDFPRGPVATLAASRGCPFLCRFCDTSTFGATVRAFSPPRVFQWMKRLHQEYGIRHIQFVDDLFLASRRRATELCHLLVEAKLPLTWSCAARVDTVHPDLLALMRKAGCWEISFGLESGSNALLQQMDKSARVERSEQAIRWTAQAGIRSKGLFMLGYPGETPETMEQTRQFVRRLPLSMMNLTKFTPYPGSPIYQDLFGTRIREQDWPRMNGMNFLWTPENLDAKTLDRWYRKILSSFYRQPRVNLHLARIGFRNPSHFIRLGRFLRAYLRFRWQKKRSSAPPSHRPQSLYQKAAS
ncbi:MAG: radical SAM protein [Planctomycetota bacterium]|nr:MAG: radical SAM protein [Planctomycetota bacterium]